MAKKTGQSGQAVIEYVVLLTVILGMGGILRYGVQKTRDKLWKFMICQVSAPCPACSATESAKKMIPQGGNCPK